ncbi:MAG: alanine/glycine:cation symporter family protein, partial [Bacteroidales bacterium]
LTSAIAATVGMGNIAGVAIALTMGGPGAIFWMWVSAVVGMATKFFEGSLAIMYKGKDSAGEVQGGPMYMITNGLGEKWKPMAVFFSVFGLIGTLCIMQANQLTEAITTVFTTPAGIENSIFLRFIIGVIICAIVSVVVLGGIHRIAKISSKVVPLMVGMYFLLVFYIIITNITVVPQVFADIFTGAFNFKAGLGGFIGVAIIGARRAALVNEAGVGTASMMHGASKNKEPIREGLIAMIGPSIDSGLVCTLTALAILINGNYHVDGEGIKGLEIAVQSFESSIPGYGAYLLMVMVFIFAFSTMFSYSYYGVKCTGYLFGAKNAKYYNYFFLIMLIVAAMIPLKTAVGLIDLAYALMALPTMITLFILAPKVRAAQKKYFAKENNIKI